METFFYENTAGILTYDGRKALHGSTLLKGSAKFTRSFNGYALPTVKYSNGGCSGFKPDSLTRNSGISTQHTTFQNRIFVSSMYFSLFYHIFVRRSTKKAALSRRFLCRAATHPGQRRGRSEGQNLRHRDRAPHETKQKPPQPYSLPRPGPPGRSSPPDFPSTAPDDTAGIELEETGMKKQSILKRISNPIRILRMWEET